MSALVIPYHDDYGARELKKDYKKFLTRGFVIAAVLHFIAIGTYWASMDFGKEERPRIIVWIRDPSVLGPPPSIAGGAPAIPAPALGIKPSIGIPVPVPDAEVSPEQTIPKQEEWYEDTGLIEGIGGENIDIKIEKESPPDVFVLVEKDPVVIKSVWPVYPEIARRAGVVGTVHLRVWVDKEGKVRKAEILKSDADIFNQPAMDAAIQWVFTPALMKSGPVSVWVSIPFRFKLQGN